MATVTEESIQELDQHEGFVLLDGQTRKHLGIGAEEFLAKWDAGELDDSDDPDIVRISLLIPFGRPDTS